MDTEERLEEFLEIIDELVLENESVPIVVEGRKDLGALRGLGVRGRVVTLNHGMSLFNFCEELSKMHRKVIILTDWDERGGRLAKALRTALAANGVRFDEKMRSRLARIAKKDVKDIESLPRFLEGLKRRMEEGLARSVADGRRRARASDRS